MTTKQLQCTVGAALVALGVGGGIGLWRTSVLKKQTARQLQQAESLLASGRAAEAIGLLHTLEPSPKIKAQELQTLIALGETARLAALWRLHPADFEDDEQAAVLAARGLLQARDTQATEKLAQSWAKKTQHPSWWLCLRADGLLAKGKRAEAKELLAVAPSTGPESASVLLRLALLCNLQRPEGRQSAWSYLEKATALAPNDPETHSFRAQLLESAGRGAQAELEYAAAWQAAPKNAVHCDQLASFYRRRGNFFELNRALEVGMALCPTDTLRVSALFWQRMALPGALPTADPPGGAQALGHFLAQLPPERFFDRTAFDSLPVAQTYAERYPEVRYLELTQALIDKQDTHAADLLTRVQRQAAWSPALERALAQLLNARGQHLRVPSLPLDAATRERHPFFIALDKSPRTPEFERFLQSPHALASAYLAVGWWEAALRLAPLSEDLSAFPAWYAYGITQALRTNRGSEAALAFVARQSAPSSALELLHAELLRATGKSQQARPLLKRLALLPEGVGFRASCLKVLDELEQDAPAAAAQTLRSRPDLAASETGQALLRAVQQRQLQQKRQG